MVHLSIAPRRERPEDIEVLAQHFLGEYAARFGVPSCPLSASLQRQLLAYRWPGNVRELSNVIGNLVALSPPHELDASLLPGAADTVGQPQQATLEERLNAYERGILVEAIEAADGNRTEAARVLGIGRATLYEKLKKHGL